MASIRKIMDLVCSGRSDTNVRFLDLRRLLTGLGFAERIKGSHHIYSHEAIPEILNLQPVGGGKAKPYQVKQVRQVVLKYGMSITER
ncbi:MAG: type II toxin-antitoxin system HicA family toxin [Phycisphaerae bacterium]